MRIFRIGQAVEYIPPRGRYAAAGPYFVTKFLPESGGEFEYCIRSSKEPHERLARESELNAVALENNGPLGQPAARKNRKR
jgi:hypothetical protein